jgi:hypothetical protein
MFFDESIYIDFIIQLSKHLSQEALSFILKKLIVWSPIYQNNLYLPDCDNFSETIPFFNVFLYFV